MAKEHKFVLGRVENIVGKGENAGYQHSLLFPQCFQKASFIGSGLCGKELIEGFFYIFTSLSILFAPCHGNSSNIHEFPGFTGTRLGL